ncbi:DsbA family protein [Colwellia sp. BRX10-3]|uniref:DsbA family protein n=1 Tax=Colwellia sp. BRX10-3 TaxID=2759844 RepID=UPI0015F67FD6|nr:DsbA family protein [Colwellia sp. BRX10-3]MBA6389813.1 DsbA family protein [Colwellia sp. BRX10-3]
MLIFRYFMVGRFLGKKAQAEVYLSLNDPHSFMLVQMLSRLAKNYQIDFKVLFIWGTLPGVTISPKLYRQWAIKDANLIAQQNQLVKITEKPSLALLATGQQTWQLLVNNIENAEQVFINTWGNQYTEHFQTSTPTINHQVKNQTRLQAKGHYAPANIFFAGDWFVGVDRLYHFENMLQKFALVDNVSEELKSNIQLETSDISSIISNAVTDINTAINTTNTTTAKSEPLVIYISLRSPYSYLGFVQAISLAERNQIELVIKPILPLLMRGASIPIVKQKYIYLDAIREAKKLGIEFNGFVDPLGSGVINAYRLFAWAQQQGKATEYILACFRAIYVDGIDLSKANNIDDLMKNLALDIEAANAYQLQHDWQQWADTNQVDLTKLDLWGVPCFSYGECCYWGQDRIPLLEEEIKNLKSIG